MRGFHGLLVPWIQWLLSGDWLLEETTAWRSVSEASQPFVNGH